MNILSEAKRLYNLGFAVHWIKPGSKAPVKAGWSSPKRDPWAVVKRDYQLGYGLGVRMGESSKIGDGYLANIDIDIKSSDPKHRRDALAVVEKQFPGLLDQAPIVKTSYGLRLFVKTPKPVRSGKLKACYEPCAVYMPTTEVNKKQLAAAADGQITKEQLDKGYRIRGAWEVELMSEGKQVVLPPSIHPETKKPYIWSRMLEDVDSIPLINVEGMALASLDGRGRKKGTKIIQNFNPEKIDIFLGPLSGKMQDAIIDGDGVDDRSKYLFFAAKEMLDVGYSEHQVLSVLTDKEYFLGGVPYEHTKSDSRGRAAAWLKEFTVRRAKEKIASEVFGETIIETPFIEDGEEVEDQTKELVTEKTWEEKLKRSQRGDIKPTLENIISILQNKVGSNLFRRDIFALRDIYGCNAPWINGEQGKLVVDDDAIIIKFWLAENFNIEPSTNIIFEAISSICVENEFHPVRDWFKTLPAWDGKNRLDTWLKKYFEAEGPDEYLAQVFRKWLVASVTRMFDPGHKFDWMPILEGEQGKGKSAFGALLFGQKYFIDWLPNLNDKDAAFSLLGNLVVEFGELARMRHSDVDTIKAFITRQIDKVRPPYGRKQIEVSRQCVFYGTTNSEKFLKDETGNRRFNPIKVGQLDFNALKRDREQLWAEAFFIHQNGLERTLYLDNGAEAHANEAQKDKLVETESDVMVETILLEIDNPIKDESQIDTYFNYSKFKMKEIFESGPLKKWDFGNKNSQYAAIALKKIPFIRSEFNLETKKIRGIKHWSLIKNG